MQRRRVVVLVAAGLLLAAGCGGGSPRPSVLEPVPLAGATTTTTGAPVPPGAPTTAPAPPATTAAAPTPVLSWKTCSQGECATLDVPLDHAQPGGRRIGIALARKKATDRANRIGSLVINPGGPGASGVDAVSYISARLPAEIRKRFDIVGFDPRGVARSNPVDCLTGPELDRYFHVDPVPDDVTERQQAIDAAKAFIAGCQKRTPDILPHVGSLDVAKDIDLLRAALGDEKLTYVGFSYGTELGTAYARQFPTRIRALVLDGAVDPLLDANDTNAQQGVGFDRALDAFLADCARRSCGWKPGEGVSKAAFQRLMAQIDRTAISGRGSRTVGPSEALLGAATALYDSGSWPTLATALQNAEGGDGAALLSLFDSLVDRQSDGSYSNLQELYNAVACIDRAKPTSVEDVERAAAEAAKAAPVFGAAIVWSGLVCALWPIPAVPFPTTSAGPLPPVLVIGTTNDPATPYESAQSLARQLGARLLTFRGEGHTAYGRNACVDRITDAYLLNGRLPPTDPTC